MPQIRKKQTSSRAANSGVKWTKDNPFSEDEVLSLIDKGKFKGGYVESKDGLVSYWLGEAEVIAYNSASKKTLSLTLIVISTRISAIFITKAG